MAVFTDFFPPSCCFNFLACLSSFPQIHSVEWHTHEYARSIAVNSQCLLTFPWWSKSQCAEKSQRIPGKRRGKKAIFGQSPSTSSTSPIFFSNSENLFPKIELGWFCDACPIRNSRIRIDWMRVVLGINCKSNCKTWKSHRRSRKFQSRYQWEKCDGDLQGLPEDSPQQRILSRKTNIYFRSKPIFTYRRISDFCIASQSYTWIWT